MAGITLRRTLLVGLALVLVVSGIGLGIWTHQSVENCKEEYPPGPDTDADCEDALTLVLRFWSVASVTIGVAILGSVAINRRRW